MSCLGPNYTITSKPPWSRKRSVCFDVVNYIAVENNETGDRENHGVFEEEAIEWFCRVSSEFSLAIELMNRPTDGN